MALSKSDQTDHVFTLGKVFKVFNFENQFTQQIMNSNNETDSLCNDDTGKLFFKILFTDFRHNNFCNWKFFG